MLDQAIPCYFFPSTVVFIDDNENFLNSLTLGLHRDICYKIFSHPRTAIEYLIQNYRNNQQLQKSIFNTDHLSGSASQIQLNLLPLQEKVYQKTKFDENAVIVVDYAMPALNGLEVCQQLDQAGIRCKKIMLTGEADPVTAIEGFNNQIIDKFILKTQLVGDLGLLNSTIYSLQKQYFAEKSQRLMQHLLLDPLVPFQDKGFIELFESICHKHQIVEYYLFDTSGSFMLLTADGTPKWFIVRNEEDKEMYCSMAADAGVSSGIYNGLTSGKIIPFYPDNGFNIPDQNWNIDCLIPATSFKYNNQKVLYYGIVENPVNRNNLIDVKRIQSFNSYRE